MKGGVDYCDCSDPTGFHQHPDIPDWYVHAECDLPTKMYLEASMLRDAIAEAWEEMDTLMDRLMTPGAAAEDGGDKFRAEATAKALMWMGEGKTLNHIRAKALERYEAQEIQAEVTSGSI